MSGKIHILDDELIGKIAAGEVVERPSSVVKELVENSIDAGADSIEVDINAAGESLIRVADNGEGMTREDAKVSCMRHSTSKINDIEDLSRIFTLGFRGEALSSIAAVSQVDITTRSSSEREATYLYIESGEAQKIRPAARDKGTTVEVHNLFYNVPARRKFLKSKSTELASITETVGRFALSYPGIEFKLTHEGRAILNIPRDMELRERVKAVLGGDVADSMVEIDAAFDEFKIRGFVSQPSCTRKDKRSQLFYVNKRYIRSKLLSDSLQGAYRSLLERGRYPSSVLYIDVDPQEVDVNIHPGKLLVKFGDEKRAREAITQAVREKFERIKESSSREIAESSVGREEAEALGEKFSDTTEIQSEFKYEQKNEPDIEEKTLQEGTRSRPSLKKEVTGEKLFQIGKCYIAKIEDEKIVLYDQHAAHERVLYEFFSNAKDARPAEVQNLLFPIRLDLAADESIIMEKLLDEFKMLGFNIELFGDNSYIVQGVPVVLKERDIKTVIFDILSDLDAITLSKTDPVDELVKITSCRAAIKAGDPLDEEEMSALINQLFKCSLPFTCPHGRPTFYEIKIDEMEKWFRRT